MAAGPDEAVDAVEAVEQAGRAVRGGDHAARRERRDPGAAAVAVGGSGWCGRDRSLTRPPSMTEMPAGSPGVSSVTPMVK
jgi:hypothetical protein